MDFRLLFLEPGRFLQEESPRSRIRDLVLVLLTASAVFGLLHVLGFIAFGNSKLGYLIDMPEGRMGPPKFDVLAIGLRTGFVVALVRLVGAAALSVATYLPMRLSGSKARFKEVFAPAVLLLAFPAIIASFSVGLNLVSYLALGNVSVLSPSAAGAAGWLIYCALFAGSVGKIGGLTGWRRRISVLPAAVLALLWLAWSAAAVWFNLALIDRISENSFNGLMGWI